MNKYLITTIAGLSLSLLSACQVVSGDRSINQYSSDAATTANVKAELLHEARISSLPIHVETDKGIVTLTGFVKNNEQKVIAGHAAKIAKGVRVIRNNIIVRK